MTFHSDHYACFCTCLAAISFAIHIALYMYSKLVRPVALVHRVKLRGWVCVLRLLLYLPPPPPCHSTAYPSTSRFSPLLPLSLAPPSLAPHRHDENNSYTVLQFRRRAGDGRCRWRHAHALSHVRFLPPLHNARLHPSRTINTTLCRRKNKAT